MDDAEDYIEPLQKGFAGSDVEAGEWDPSDAIIWVPDLSSRTGFSKFWVSRKRAPSDQEQPFGFRKGP